MVETNPGPTSGPVTGGRVTRKVRATVARFPELGALRHVETNPPRPGAWLVVAAVWVLFSVAPALGNGTPADIPFQAVGTGLVFGLILWYLGSEKLLVLERGLIVGSHAPFLRPYVVPFRHLDASSVTAARSMPRIGAMLPGAVPLTCCRTAVWARDGVAFVAAPGPAAYRDRVERSGVLGPAPRARVVWWFGTWRPTAPLLGALEAALVAYGAPGAPGLADRTSPPVRLSGDPRDADGQLPHVVGALRAVAA